MDKAVKLPKVPHEPIARVSQSMVRLSLCKQTRSIMPLGEQSLWLGTLYSSLRGSLTTVHTCNFYKAGREK